MAVGVSEGSEAGYSGHAVEVAIAGRETRDPATLHHGENQSIAAQEAMRAAQVASEKHVLGRYRQHMHPNADNFVECLTKSLELSNFKRMTTKTLSDTRIRPAKRLTGFKGHQPVSDVV